MMTVSDRIDYYYPQLDKSRVRRYINSILKVAKKQKFQEVLKQKLDAQVQQVQKVSMDRRSSKERIGKELDKLREAVQELMKTETRMAETQQKETGSIDTLNQRILMMQKKLDTNEQEIRNLRQSLTKLSPSAAQKDTGRFQEQIRREIEEKSRATKAEITDIENQIKILETKFGQLKRKKETTKEDIDRIKQRIGSAKKTLTTLKKKK